MFARDPFELDRKLSNAARAWWRFRRELRTSDARDHVFETASAVADVELLEELAEDASPLSVPMRRWVYRLLEQRRHREAITAVASAYRRETEPVLAPLQAELAPRELLLNALSDDARRDAFLTALARHSAKLRDRRLALGERRFELRERLARRLEPLTLEPNPKLQGFARDLLARTAGALEALSVRDLAGALEVSLATRARATYPSHLSLRSLVDLLDASRWFDSVPLDPGELPARLAPASFARGLAQLGAALRRGAESTSSSPFVLASDAFALPEHTLGALFERLPLSEEFARRRLEVARSAFPDYQRAWAAAALLEARTAAARLLTLPSSFQGSSAFAESFQEELGRALGFELDPRFAGVLFAPRLDEAQRFAARLEAARLDRDLVVRHDEDWFRNPRAREELREQARSPATLELGDGALEAGVLEHERSLTSALAR
jgi:hypothetical protein